MNSRPSNLPTIIVTGASGFIGRHFLDTIKNDFYIYALARRSQKAAGIPIHKNIIWIRVDIAVEQAMKEILNGIANQGGADYLLHLAGFYDFSNKSDQEYYRTNAIGTRNILENSKILRLKRFIFASSLTVTEFCNPNVVINEDSPTDAKFPYALSKKEAEIFIKDYSSEFPCTIIRQAAIYSDWCEYMPLYSFLSTWLSAKWNCRVLGGKGDSAIPYLHINELCKLFLLIIKQTEQLPIFNILIASPDNSESHKELFKIAVGYNYFQSIKPFYVPKFLAYAGIIVRYQWGRIIGKLPFERFWMAKYIDHKMRVDASNTRKILSWIPIARYDIKRRLLFIIANMKNNPFEWKYKNETAPVYAIKERQYLKIYECMIKLKDQIINEIFARMSSQKNTYLFETYQHLEIDKLINRIEYLYNMLENGMRTGDRTNILEYGSYMAGERFIEGFKSVEVIRAIELTAEITIDSLMSQSELEGMEQRIHDEIMVTLQMVIDKIEDTYENLIDNKRQKTENKKNGEG
ncbi:MAG: NAD(P)-dependent oxidoreductase [Calditrichia bacterium]|nr:NAD(P)-dependent oxidoreductase [Calditrichia bacterium]